MTRPIIFRARYVFRVLALLFAFVSCAQAAPRPSGKSPLSQPKISTISIQTYRAQLQAAIEKLKQLETRAPRDIAPVLKSLAKDQIVKRGDGQTQTSSGDQWKRWGDDDSNASTPAPYFPTPKKSAAIAPTQNVSRAEVEKLRRAVEVRLRELDNWSASTYAPADAQNVMRQLEGSGQIRVGPTWWQQFTSDVNKWIKNTFTNFLKWIGGLFPSAAPGQLPNIDGRWIKAFFFATVAALLFILGFLVWRAVGGRIGRRGAKRGVLAEGEDAELLLLPPDELRLRATQFAREGNFREALRHLYIALLLSLDARGVWRYDARRTNWEHIAALRGDANRSTLVAPLSGVTRTFDRVRYGNADFNSDDWTRFERDVNGVESQAPNA